ncbi:serine/threonine-protein phosphatase 4 regulatory subunit 2 [Selaginella moellendorffii]|uniref:serine/threonine-protein phosphatase 4 regulatory subunit 2 n=1 Tax=Selaginella moellendorffii TaxID=88036 RepID=UPI000D1C272D|nr:serine/threonine-protein phosphatase 4 regulatory subunit 2 [Selaginella moellendorffii]|eukprot:XP_024538038.1 serine/threonine-protein phosphatase 4 regulatory subunit 2 [Selaginella moellendorffii]
MWEDDNASLAALCSGADGSSMDFTPELRRIVSMSAKSGKYWHDWHHLRQLLQFRLNQVVKRLYLDTASSAPPTSNEANGADGEKAVYSVLKKLAAQLASFEDAAPFTLQRICELLLEPDQIYSTIDKFELAFEKLLLVTSTLDPVPPDSYPAGLATAPSLDADAKNGGEQNEEHSASKPAA